MHLNNMGMKMDVSRYSFHYWFDCLKKKKTQFT